MEALSVIIIIIIVILTMISIIIINMVIIIIIRTWHSNQHHAQIHFTIHHLLTCNSDIQQIVNFTEVTLASEDTDAHYDHENGWK